MKELGRIVGYAILSAVANVVAMWAGYKLKEETSKQAKTDEES